MKNVGWRRDAANIVEELFRVTTPDAWDDLLELRGALLGGASLTRTLDVFLRCRERFEADHYLPLYRLRRLLAASLRVEAVNLGTSPWTLEEILRAPLRSFAEIERRLRRECFEHLTDSGGELSLRVVES